MPRAKNETYTVFGSTGSNFTRRAPRGEQAVWFSDTWSGVDAVHNAGAPWFTSSQLAPPLSDR